MSKKIFITATDTGAGKTYAATGLLQTTHTRKLQSIGLKPVASGCELLNGKLMNTDALQLQQTATISLDYDSVNPFTFAPAIAPHLAAGKHPLSVDGLLHHTQSVLAKPADIHIIEGFGGWHAPLNMHETMADYVRQLSCEVLLVVGIRLGCLNHAILTERAIRTSGVNCIGWIANMIDPDMSHQQENIETLQTWLQSPLLGVIPNQTPAHEALHNHIIF